MNFSITYEGKELNVSSAEKDSATIYTVDFPSGIVSYERKVVDNNEKIWLQNGKPSPVAATIGQLIDEKLLIY